jgi:hypothetical protein
MPQTHEWMFYEVAWRTWARGQSAPLPWWVQQCFRRWSDAYDSGLFDSKEAAFASNALYRYWNMVGVKDHHQESLVGQAGEIEPVYDKYALGFFLFDPDRRGLHLPQMTEPDGQGPVLTQQLEADYLPVILTTYRAPLGVEVRQKVLATTLGVRQRTVVLDRLVLGATDSLPKQTWLCLVVTPAGPSGFQRHDRAGRYLEDGRVAFLRYVPDERRVEVNTIWGPIFDQPPVHFGCYGNPEGSYDPDYYVDDNPFRDLVEHGSLNGHDTATDHVAGMCTAAFAWPFELTAQNPTFALNIKLAVDDYRGPDDLAELHAAKADDLESANHEFWTSKLDDEGLQASLPQPVTHLFDLFRLCRATLMILADAGEIHPGPTIYDSFWVRDSSVEGIAAALAGDSGLAERQFGLHYPRVFNLSWDRVGPVSARGFFGGEHEKNDHEWDSNGQVLWALGRLDRILGPAGAFGARMFSPYVVEGARWLRDNRSSFGLLHSGWSAEHIGDKDKPHYWDDFWGLAGLYEAARMAERLGAQEVGELWAVFDDLKRATRDSILWVLDEQRRRGLWETFIPTGPADVGRLDSTMIGALSYFHPCRLYMGSKLGGDIDQAAHMTLETIWHHFVDGGGFRHDAAWNAYGPYLTLQLAHAFLFSGDLERMDECLRWSVDVAFALVSRRDGDPTHPWQVVSGAWNEQHCYPVAKDFAEKPDRWWYMGDIPHGWAAAEFNLLLRDILFFEADEDGDRHIYLASGVPPHWVGDGQSVSVAEAPTIFGGLFGYRLSHDAGEKRVDLEILRPPAADVRFVYPCRFGSGVAAASVDGAEVPVSGRNINLPAGAQHATVRYEE